MKKLFLIVLMLLVNTLAAMDRLPAEEQYEILHVKNLPVPQGEEPRSIDLQEEEAVTRETFEELIQRAASEGRPFILAEVITKSPDSPRPYTHYFDAQYIEQWQKDNLENILDPLNRLPVEKIYYYKITSPEEEFVFDQVVNIQPAVQPAVQPQPVIEDQVSGALQELFNTLPGHPSLGARYNRGGNSLGLSNLNLGQMSQEELNTFFIQLAQIVPNLTSLDISDNQLTALPATIGNLANLQRLYISYNPLEQNQQLENLLTALRGRGVEIRG